MNRYAGGMFCLCKPVVQGVAWFQPPPLLHRRAILSARVPRGWRLFAFRDGSAPARRATTRRWTAIGVFLAVAALVFPSCYAADVALATGSGQSLLTASVLAPTPLSDSLPRLSLDLAFATDETPQGGSFLDSFSVSLRSADGSRTALLLTADAFGLQLAPPNPGGFSIAPGSIRTEVIPYFGSASDPAGRVAIAVSFDVPLEFTAQTNTVLFDLFDNGNAAGSLGLARNIAVVPEPAIGLLLLAGTVVGLFIKRFRS